MASRNKDARRIISDALGAKPVDVRALVDVALTCGLGDDETRRRVWPLLLSLNLEDSFVVDGPAIPPDEQTSKVVDVDVPRSMHTYDVVKGFDDDKRERMRATLKSLIYKSLDLTVDPVTAAARPRPRLHYYQGYEPRNDRCAPRLAATAVQLQEVCLEISVSQDRREVASPHPVVECGHEGTTTL
jgi:hypothetical protein